MTWALQRNLVLMLTCWVLSCLMMVWTRISACWKLALMNSCLDFLAQQPPVSPCRKHKAGCQHKACRSVWSNRRQGCFSSQFSWTWKRYVTKTVYQQSTDNLYHATTLIAVRQTNYWKVNKNRMEDSKISWPCPSLMGNKCDTQVSKVTSVNQIWWTNY